MAKDPSGTTIGLSREDMMTAVSEGVYRAFTTILDNNALMGTTITDAIRAGVSQAVGNSLDGINAETILEAIREGTKTALDQVYASQILDAIADVTKEAMQGGKR